MTRMVCKRLMDNCSYPKCACIAGTEMVRIPGFGTIILPGPPSPFFASGGGGGSWNVDEVALATLSKKYTDEELEDKCRKTNRLSEPTKALLRLLDIERVENAKLIAENNVLKLRSEPQGCPTPGACSCPEEPEEHDWTANTHNPKPPLIS